MNAHLIILALAVVGIMETFYLYYQRRRRRLPVCVIGDSCADVWKSPYSKTFGVGNDVLGIVFYATVAVIEVTLLIENYDSLAILGEILFISTGTAISCYFVYIQWRVIRAWCFWCVLSAVITWVMLATRLFL